jgi:hypothetical protein
MVRWNNTLSDKRKVTCGVRQGGVLSPVLLNTYVDDLVGLLSILVMVVMLVTPFMVAVCMQTIGRFCRRQFVDSSICFYRFSVL